jgi:alkyl hydroperoxide reductase subunit AhpC
MTLRIGDEALDFTADTQGKIRFHEWIAGRWAILFSHPKDFTPVCTSELGSLAALQPEFEARDCRVIGLSVDPVASHTAWLRDIEVSQGRNFNEVLRLLDSLQLTLRHAVATPVNWTPGEDVIIPTTVSDEDARRRYPAGWKTLTPYLRVVTQPR